MATIRNIIRKYRVPQKLGISRATLDLWLNPKSRYFDPTLPSQISLGKNSAGFLEQDLDAWLDARMSERNKQERA